MQLSSHHELAMNDLNHVCLTTDLKTKYIAATRLKCCNIDKTTDRSAAVDWQLIQS